MSLTSMTGFGRSQGMAGDIAWVWEVRSVNSRGLDVRLRLPGGFDLLDQPVRKLAGQYCARGNVSIGLQVERQRQDNRHQVNERWLAELTRAAIQLSKENDPENFAPIQPDGLLALRGVIEAGEEDAEALTDDMAKVLLQGAEEALSALAAARKTEGQALFDVLSSHLDTIEGLTGKARDLAETQPQALQTRILRSVTDLLQQSPQLPEERIAQEVALLASKADVREELDRLSAHIASGHDLIAAGKPCGRKLEFLAQEFHREANTLGSKSQDIELTRIGLDLKATIDQVREQVANVE